MTVTIMDMLPWTAQIRYHCQAHRHAAEVMPPTGMIDPPLGIIATPDVSHRDYKDRSRCSHS